MKRISILLALSILCLPAHANTLSFKEGVIVTSMRNASKFDPYHEVSYEHKNIEFTVGYYSILLKGEEWLGTNALGQGVFGNNQYRARLHCFPITIGYKHRFTDRLYAGAGFGYQILSTERMYDDVCGETLGQPYGGKPRTHDPHLVQLKVGYEINDRLAVEIKSNFSDLDIESGVFKIGIAEDKSNLNMTMLSLVWRL